MPPPDREFMGSTISGAALLASSLSSSKLATEISVAVLKKANDVAGMEGAALVELLQDSMVQTEQRLVDVYA